MNVEDRHLNQKLVRAYNRMMERVKEALHQAKGKTGPKLQQAIDKAQDKAVELGELTREEAEKIGDYLRRDLSDAADFLAGQEKSELAEWLRFDINLIEAELLDLFFSAADQAKLDMLDFEESLAEHEEYHAGQITGPGTLICEECGEHAHFHQPGLIPPCPKCGGRVYQR